MSEQSPQPQPDILTEARAYNNLDAWLSGIPDERLQQITDTLGRQVDDAEPADEETLSNLLGVAMHFSGNEAMTIPEISKAMQALVVQVGIEINVRNGILTKDGEYSMHPDGKNAIFTMTDKGKELHEGGA